MRTTLWYSRKMPRRFKVLAALLLAIVICLVLVLPQVDLDNGVLRDVGSQVMLLMFVAFATALILFLPPVLFRAPREVSFRENFQFAGGGLSVLSLRC